MRKPKITLLLNPLLFCGGVLCLSISLGLCILMIVLSVKGIARSDNPMFFQLWWGVMGAVAIGASLICLPKWFSRVTLTAEGIIFRKPFARNVFRPYQSYPYIHRAWYWHGSLIPCLGYRAGFIVLTSCKLNAEQLQQINMVEATVDTIIIRCRKRVYECLLQALPPKQARKLEFEFRH